MKTTTTPALEKIVRSIGDRMVIRGHIEVMITKVWPLGTVDVVTAAGSRFRVTGLRIYR